jgi:hypothetical protein
MTPEESDRFRDDIMSMIERTVDANLRDPDLAMKSTEFHDGYRRGFREASLAMVLQRLRKIGLT